SSVQIPKVVGRGMPRPYPNPAGSRPVPRPVGVGNPPPRVARMPSEPEDTDRGADVALTWTRREATRGSGDDRLERLVGVGGGGGGGGGGGAGRPGAALG